MTIRSGLSGKELNKLVLADMRDFHMHRIGRLEESDAQVSLFIHNLIEIRKSKSTGIVRLYKFDVVTGIWSRIRIRDIELVTSGRLPSRGKICMPDIKLFSTEAMKGHILMACMTEIARQHDPALCRCGKCLGKKRGKCYEPRKNSQRKQGSIPRDLGNLHISKLMFMKQSLKAGDRFILKMLWRHFLNKRIATLAVQSKWTEARLSDYIAATSNPSTRAGIKRLSKENPNLTLLAFEDSSSGDRSYLSKSKWIDDKRILSARSFRFMKSLPPSCIRGWVACSRNPEIMEAVCLATQGMGFRASILRTLMINSYKAYVGNYIGYENEAGKLLHPSGIKLIRLMGLHLLMQWKENGFQALRHELGWESPFIGHATDWHKTEGYARGLPDRNFGVDALLRNIAEWDARRNEAIRKEQAEWGEHDDDILHFPSCQDIPQGFSFEPLDTLAAMRQESLDMDHCVADYWHDCVFRGYRAWKVEGPKGDRATLGVFGPHWVIDQIRGMTNAVVPDVVRTAAKKFVAGLH